MMVDFIMIIMFGTFDIDSTLNVVELLLLIV